MAIFRYQFVTGETQGIEISEELNDMLLALDHQERNNNRRETRRHVSSDMLVQKHGYLLPDKHEDALGQIVNQDSLEELLSALTPQQRALLRRVYLEGMPMTDIAREEGVLKQAISERIRRAISKMLVNHQ